MAQKSFSAQVSEWVKETKERQIAVRNEAAQRVIAIMQTPVGQGGNLPFDTGFLRASLMAVIGNANFELKANPESGAAVPYDAGQISLIIAKAKLSDTVEAVYTAKYARRMEYGFSGKDSLGRTYNQTGRRFVALAAQQWPRIVSEVATEAKARAKP